MNVRLFSMRPYAGSEGKPARAHGLWRDMAALVLLAAGVFVGSALLSFWMAPQPRSAAVNWMGPVGGRLASALSSALGWLAWGVPFGLWLAAVPIFRRRRYLRLGPRLAADGAVLLLLAAMVHVAVPEPIGIRGIQPGGNLGLFFGEVLRAWFSTPGSLLVGFTLLALLMLARDAFSLVDVWERWLRAGARLRDSLSQAWSRLFRMLRPRAGGGDGLSWVHALPAEGRERLGRLRDQWRRSPPAALGPAGATTPEPAAAAGGGISATESGGAAEPLHESSDGAHPVAGEASGDDEHEYEYEYEYEYETEGEGSPAHESGDSADEGELADAESDDGPESDLVFGEPGQEAPEGGPRIVDTRPLSAVVQARPLPALEPEDVPMEEPQQYTAPSPDLLQPTPSPEGALDRGRVLELSQKLEETLANYGVVGKVDEIHPGPTVTTYEVTPKAGTKVSKVSALSDDLALGLSRSVRIIAPIPGKSRIGFELPNDRRIPVNLRELVEDQRFQKLSDTCPLPVVMGRDIVGAPFYADLASMPHVIVAGATGAGKSVGLNVMLCSLLFQRSPDELRLLMIDPKVVELAPFDGIPHMLLPVVTDMKQAATALRWAVDEMERRYQAFATAGTKNIVTYNRWVDRLTAGEIPPPSDDELELLLRDGSKVTTGGQGGEGGRPAWPGRLPYLVVVVDEFADLMMQQGKEVETAVARLAQKARAAGMHVVLATQRPSVDVITGMIKANFPTRVAYRVAQKVDSRTILDEQGAELLLGKGDMLAKLNGSNQTLRVQCPFISEEEVAAVTDHLRRQGMPAYHDDILKSEDGDDGAGQEELTLDPRYDEAVAVVADTGRCSTSWLQRKLGIGYNRAAKIVEMMEQQGIVGPPNGSKEREVFVNAQ